MHNPFQLIDPMYLKNLCWPNVQFYDKQLDMIYSTVENVETVVTAGNMLGKDFVSAFICLMFFLSAMIRKRTCRIVTTSVAERHLKVLWGEIGRYISTSKYPLIHHKGGPLIVNHMAIYRASETDVKNPINYLVGKVCEKDEGFSGHHADITLAVVDEASGVANGVYEHMAEWAKRILIFGNPNPTANFFYRAVKGGDIQ
jgi:hypothetical protein